MSDKPISPEESLLTFPCEFTLKIFGLRSDEFESAVLMIIHKHVPNFSDTAIQTRPSQEGKYCALSISVHVESREQLDNIYRDLSSSPQVIMVL
jgi:putative lipoic acid-binding regulatory protein